MSWATVVFVVFSSLVVGYVGQTVMATDSGRLPDDTEPLSYKLTMEPSPYKEFNASFTGSVDIEIAVRTSTSAITLNSKDLVLHDIRVTDKNTGRSIGVRSWSYDADREQVTISLDGHVLASRVYMLRISFEGILREDGTGFFRSAYYTVSKRKKWIVATQFQTTRARSAFPCYDEPHFRTPFNITMIVYENDTALSNMPVFYSSYENMHGSSKVVYFQETPSMSTCSVAFFAGEFERIVQTRPQAINVYSHLGRLYQIEYLTKGSPELLRAMEDYTGIPYAMPELNLVATPILGSGQVNTWGLTTYQEKTLFVNHQSNSKSVMTAKMAVANAVASQWFGNLVSPAGWEFAWINKGLTTYYQYFVTAKVEPEWRLEHFFIAENQRPAMDLDQNLQIQPLNAPVIGPEDVDFNSADRFSKQKASAVIFYLEEYGRRVLVHFQETPSMPTCSVAFFAGEFEQFDKTRSQAINIYSHLGRLYQIEYITKGSPELLTAMEDYTGIPYAMPELNLVATPILGSGQVNTWGLTTYQEKTLFVNHQSNSKSVMTANMAVANTVASQWFGNLVSPASWEFAWINKGLSTYLQYFVTAKVEPEWRLEHFFIAENQRPAMDLDQNLQIQPLNAPLIGPGDVDFNSADRFSKQKASAVMRMLNDWVGEDAFKKAINAYLTHNQYSSAKPEQLWNAFDNTLFDMTKSGLNGNSVRTVMNTWTERAGYPLVNVKKKDKSLVLTQQRFLSGFTDSNDTTKWFIRLSYTTNKEKNFDTKTAPTVWLDPSVNETIIPIDDDVEWYIFNIQSTGYYRINYTEDNWLSLIKQLNDSPKDIHVLNRAQLIDDSFSLAKVGLLNYTIPMSISEYLKMEDDIIPWYSAMKSFDYIVNRMKRYRNTYMDVTYFIIKLAFGALQKLNDLVAQKSANRPTTIAWNALSTWMCKLQEYACGYQPASQYFQRWQNGEEISADIKDVAFCVGLRPSYYNPETLDKLLTIYNTTKSYSERESVIKALPCADVQTLFTYLTLILENKCPIEPSDYDDFFNALSSTSNGITAMNDFLGKHFADIVNNVKDGKNIAKTMFSILASKVSTDSEMENMMKMAFKIDTPVEFRNKLVPVYQNEVKDYEKWFHNGSPRTIWVHINPSATRLHLDPSDVPTPSPTKDDSSASSRLHNYAVILQILALSVSVKFLVHVI